MSTKLERINERLGQLERVKAFLEDELDSMALKLERTREEIDNLRTRAERLILHDEVDESIKFEFVEPDPEFIPPDPERTCYETTFQKI